MKHFLGLFACLLVGPNAGCITTAGDSLPDLQVEAARSLGAIEQTVGAFSFHLDGGKMVTSNKMGRQLNDEILNRWRRSGFISGHKYVKSSDFTGQAEYQLTLSGHQEGDSSVFMQVISGLTLLLIPHHVDSQMSLTYSIEHAPSRCTFSASASDSFGTLIGLLMIPAAPFMQGGRTRTYERLANHLYDGLAKQGAFAEHETCADPVDQGPPGDPSSNGASERLEELEELRRKGLITPSEFDTKREEILDDL